jgi:hypothetical protein
MKLKNLERLKPGNLVTFLILCIFWFLEFSGLLSGLLHRM